VTVTGTSGTVTALRSGLIRVGQPPAIALIGGTIPASASDTSIANHLIGLGYQVTLMDDEPANRPGALLISQSYNLVIVSSTVTSSNIGSEFRNAAIPMIFWESSLLRSGLETLSDNGTTVGTQTQITVTNNTHPVMQGVALGNVTMFTSNQTLSYGTGNFSAPVQILATRVGQPTQAMVMVADRGTTMIGNYILPGRRVFLFLGDTNYTAANATARLVLDNAVCWAIGLNPTITTQPPNVNVPTGQTAMMTVGAAGQSPLSYQWRKGGVAVANGGRVSGATTATLTITGALASDTGSYSVVVTNSCGSTTSLGGVLRVGVACVGDFNGSGALSVQDIFDFLTAYFAGSMSADFNFSGSVTVQDIFDFLGAYFAGCG
jgi:hypothetical protein